jgi:uncharacterized membrane protein YhaH (DUF805 family)
MGFFEAVKTVLSKYAGFSGRATRPEYWYFVLFYMMCNFACSVLDKLFGTHFPSGGNTGYFSTALAIVLTIPYLAVGFRRLHDTEHSGWWVGGMTVALCAASIVLIYSRPLGAILFVGLGVVVIMQLVWLCSAGTPGPNQYGPPPPTAVIPEPIASE